METSPLATIRITGRLRLLGTSHPETEAKSARSQLHSGSNTRPWVATCGLEMSTYRSGVSNKSRLPAPRKITRGILTLIGTLRLIGTISVSVIKNSIRAELRISASTYFEV